MIDLCEGEWLLRPDPGNVGLAEDWHRVRHNPPAWKPVTVPSAWQHTLGLDFHSFGWYRRTVAIPSDWKWQRSWLRFEAVATEARVWVNGCEVGRHIGDYLAFECEITGHVTPGEELDIVVRVDEVMGHITKGFHDMLSAHHGGLWQPVVIVGSGPVHVMPEDVGLYADAHTGGIGVTVGQSGEEIQVNGDAVRVRVGVCNSAGTGVAEGGGEWDRAAETFECEVTVPNEEVVLWRSAAREGEGEGKRAHAMCPYGTGEDTPPGPLPGKEGKGHRLSLLPSGPGLMGVRVAIECRDATSGQWVLSDEVCERVGFRTVETDGRHVLLNGEPIFLRGMLHWGHEPRHIAPAPTPGQVRAEMEQLLAMGFNCICLCMWYAPRYFYEIADELGMLIWQEHPCWHSPMEPEYLDEYRRLFAGFMKRDRNRPSVVIVSATCEHPCFDGELAAWWWARAKSELPGKLHQVQTSSFAWSNPEQTDLYDEHTYDNNDRWVCYLHDLQAVLGEMETPKPFVMGESVLFTSWPDLDRIACEGRAAAWWKPTYLESGLAFENSIRKRYGEAVLDRFKQQADRYHLLGRKFQIERFRSYSNHAGLVTNHLRDVPAGSFGFMDDFDQWRFGPADMRGWLAEVPLILETPGHHRGFASGDRVPVRVRVSNLSGRQITGAGEVEFAGRTYRFDVSRVGPGEIGRSNPVELEMPAVQKVTRHRLTVRHAGLEDGNEWDLWVFPSVDMDRERRRVVRRMTGLPFTAPERKWDDLEKGYSRGFGIEAKSWTSTMPDAATLLPEVEAWECGSPIPDGVQVIVTHRLTLELLAFMEQGGGCVVLLASKGAGGMGARYEWLFGGRPLVVEGGPIAVGASDWVVDLLGMDLTRCHARVMPVEDLGLTDCIEPLLRLVYTHDESCVKMYDFAWMAPVGAQGGMLMATSLDHGSGDRDDGPGRNHAGLTDGRNVAGRYMLRKMVAYCVRDRAINRPVTPVDPDALRRLCVDGDSSSV
ncbi:MAG: hypothetical protein HND57_01065 [Planctomycetes bacterium]|nr:hypothetical protein [Planctomycetota bacterium]